MRSIKIPCELKKNNHANFSILNVLQKIPCEIKKIHSEKKKTSFEIKKKHPGYQNTGLFPSLGGGGSDHRKTPEMKLYDPSQGVKSGLITMEGLLGFPISYYYISGASRWI